MKRLLIILLLVLSILTIGCTSQVIADTTITPETVTVTSIVEVENTDRIEKLEDDNFKLEAELEKYKELIAGLNDLLGNVYYGYASNSNWISDGFTAFTINYNDKYYLLTAGHCVHYQYNDIDSGIFTDFKFKANFSDEWIYPKLLTYENEYNGGRDFAVLYSDKITNGFTPNTELTYPAFILGHGDKLNNDKYNIIKIKDYSITFDGESGSPIINIDGEALGIMTGMMTNIEVVLEAIDNIN